MSEEQSPSNFIPQENGGVLPSSELMERVRANPKDYPHAAQDFSDLSKGQYTPEQIQDIIDNPFAKGSPTEPLITGADEILVDAAQGALTGLGVAARKTGEFFDVDLGVSEALEDAAQFLDPKLETEKSTGESLTEGAGQAVPAIGTAAGAFAATGGAIAPVLVGAAASTATFENDENLINVMEEFFPEYTPDQLVVQEDDTEGIATLKHFTANLMTDASIPVIGRVLGKALKILKGGDPKQAIALLEEVADDADVLAQLDDDIAQIFASPAVVEAQKVPTVVLDQQLLTGVTKALDDEVAVLNRTMEPVVEAAPREYVEAFTAKIEKPLKQFEARGRKTTDLPDLPIELKAAYKVQAEEVAEAAYRGDNAAVLDIIKGGLKVTEGSPLANLESLPIYESVLRKTALEHMDNKFHAVIQKIRANPDVKTAQSLSEITRESLYVNSELYDLYRRSGTAASHALSLRKGSLPSELLDDLPEVLEEFDEDVLREGIGLFDSKTTFVQKKIIALEDSGINAAQALDDIYKMFDEFELANEGKREILGRKTKLTGLEKQGLIARYVQVLKDLQGSMLLGQYMTSLTEILSTGAQTALLPMMQTLGGGSGSRMFREYMGMMASTALARRNFTKSLKLGKDIVDDWYFKEGSFSRLLDHEEFLKQGWSGQIKSLLWRMLTHAVDLSQASTAFFKTSRAFGISYADGLQAARKSGLKGKAAREAAKDYAQKRFSPDGAIIDEDLRNLAAQAPFQTEFDGSTMTGKLGQWIENLRNSSSFYGLGGLALRGVLPFFRTLTNIGSRGAQMILPPGSSFALKKFTPEGTHIARFLDDFTGKNGEAAAQVARGYNRLGMSMVGAAFAITQMEGVEITGPSRTKRWDAKKQAFELLPASSLIIGNEALDLSRLLPVSAPLMTAGVLRDYQLADRLRMEGGEYSAENTELEWLGNYFMATGVASATLLQDSGAARGVFDLFDAIVQAVTEQDMKGVQRYSQNFAMQFTPGPVKVANKAGGDIYYEGYDFLDRWKAQAGMVTDYERLDIFGHTVHFPVGKGIDPSNRRVLKLDDPAYAEAALLNRLEGMAITVGHPRDVFNKTFWKNLGVDTTSFGNLGNGNAPILSDLKTIDGKNAWLAYRDMVLKGRVTGKPIKKSTSGTGDRISIGSIEVLKGENFEDAMRRMIATPEYERLTLDARVKVWKTTFSIFKKEAKEYLETHIKIDPSMFEGSRYGSAIQQPELLGDTIKVTKDLAKDVQLSKGSPVDRAFSIQD